MMKTKKIKLANITQCTGCMACVSTCNTESITVLRKKGFYYPTINHKNCKMCGACVKVCPILNKTNSNKFERGFFTGFSKDFNWRIKCSSGGMFGVFSNYALSNNWIIYGAIYNKKTSQIEHASSCETTVHKMYGSKYVQCVGENKFKEIKKQLDLGEKILYCGLPCEVNGLIHFLGKKYDNLTTIDFICHGVPSPALFNKLVKEESKHSSIDNLTFREKDDSFPNQKMIIYFNDGQI
ncbi:MAG: Coenzyme F420 hydrogenase/dehydrogenase, beta subunit C-terminal domain, partial [Bacilli bacterium]|nr:Coenzyme F420 hydrogenase/dehydrogenase, beta subunit C-terminal domain [Bacilli bacterium]